MKNTFFLLYSFNLQNTSLFSDPVLNSHLSFTINMKGFNEGIHLSETLGDTAMFVCKIIN